MFYSIIYMNDKSILDKILDNNIKEEAAILDSRVILDTLFSVLREKEQSVLSQRFGLENNKKVTLESIGSAYNLTRERIRQIENTAVNKIRKHQEFDRYTASLRHVINGLMEEHGGIIEHQYLIDNLSHLSALANGEQDKDIAVLRNRYTFILSKLLSDQFDYIKENSHYDNLWKQKFASIEHLEELLRHLLNKLNELREVLRTEQIISLIKESEIYGKHEDKLNISNNFDISSVIKNKNFSEDADTINENKALYSLLRLSKNLNQNKFGYWGLFHWPEINPKTINHKIYLVMKNHQKPLHFKEIADQINDISFDRKKANPATVHNELILDDKYILIGRGIYALKEWGYDNGTVSDVVEKVLKETGIALSKDEIIEKVLEKRLVKEATINLALMNKEKFKKENNKYSLV